MKKKKTNPKPKLFLCISRISDFLPASAFWEPRKSCFSPPRLTACGCVRCPLFQSPSVYPVHFLCCPCCCTGKT